MMKAAARSLLQLLPVLALIGAGEPVHAQSDPEVPAELQVALLARMLPFDRALVSRAGDELVIGIVHQPRNPASRDFAREVEAAWQRTRMPPISGLKVRVVPIRLDDVAGLTRALRTQGVDVALIAPLRAIEVASVLAAVRAAGAASVGSVPAWVDHGYAIGFAVQHGKPRIRINLPAARAEGADFAAELLHMAEVVR